MTVPALIYSLDRIFDILRDPKANQIDKISCRTMDICKYFPESYSSAKIQEHIIKLLEADCRKRQRAQERQDAGMHARKNHMVI